ncbi:Metallo-peptidase family M12-domain-containing protein [Phyllosticta capitalensis]
MRLVRAVAATACVVVASLPTLGHASSFARNPLNALEILRNPSVHTYNHRVTALSHFDLTFDLRDGAQLVRLSLEPNHDILADDATVEYIGPDGQVTRREPIDRLDHKIYKGRAWVRNNENAVWQDRGWARLNVRRDGVHPLFEGVFSVDHDHHHIQMSSSYTQTKHAMDPALEDSSDEVMVVWRDSDISAVNYGSHDELKKRGFDDGYACQADGLPFNSNPEHPIFAPMLKRDERSWGSVSMSNLFSKRQIDTQPGGNSAGVNLVSTIGQTSGCPSARKVALVGVATDCTYTGSFNSSESARQNVISVINSASDLYETTFNITLGLRNLTVSDASCPGTPQQATKWNQACADSITIQDRLNMFSEWRGSRPDTNSHWTLLTTCNTGQAVGLAWLGQACVQGVESGGGNSTGSDGSTNSGSGETVASANVVARTNTEWQVVAHETGHTFGAVHDCTSETCADSSVVNSQQCCPLSSSQCDAGSQFIMNPSTARGITKFSPCSIGNICSAMGRNSVKTNCFTNNKGVTTISGQQCGNGIVEEGEDCDCGGADGCGNNPCCNPTTCKFKSGAVCDDSNEDCCRGCQFASNGTVCRESTGQCDPQEVCSGDSAYCPADTNAEDGTKCGDGLKCASGQCTSRDQQCKTALGAYTQGTNDTYACNHQTCQISCASPEFGANVCYNLQQNFLDGTECGGGGHCKNGRCSGSSTAKEIGSWIQDHKGIVIGICVAIGALLLLSLLGCISRRIRRRSANRRAKTAPPWVPPPPPGMAMGPGPGGYPPGPGGPAPFPPPHMPRSPMPWAPNGRQTPDSQRPFAMDRGSVSGATSSGTGSWHGGAPPIPPPVPAHPPPAYGSVRYA